MKCLIGQQKHQKIMLNVRQWNIWRRHGKKLKMKTVKNNLFWRWLMPWLCLLLENFSYFSIFCSFFLVKKQQIQNYICQGLDSSNMLFAILSSEKDDAYFRFLIFCSLWHVLGNFFSDERFEGFLFYSHQIFRGQIFFNFFLSIL